MTETTGAGTVLSPEEHDRSGKAGSSGCAWPGLKIVVIDEAGYELPPGEHGELVIARSEEHTSELQSLMPNSYAVFCLKKKKTLTQTSSIPYTQHPDTSSL